MGCFSSFLSGFARCILVILNFVVLICAVILVVLGATFENTHGVLTQNSVGTVAIGFGVAIGFIAFFGFVGAISKNSCMLITYGVIMLVIFTIQLILGIVLYIAVEKGLIIAESGVDEFFKLSYDQHDMNSENFVDQFQGFLKCCGRYGPNGPEVRTGEFSFSSANTQLISSCCNETFAADSCYPRVAYQQGCVYATMRAITESCTIIGIVAISFSVLELLCAVFAFYTCRNRRKESIKFERF